MADRNVLSIAFDDSASTNYESQSLFVQKLAPRNVNLSATGVLSGDVIWEINTPKDTFLDLSKTYMSAEFEMDEKKDDTICTHKRLLLPCMFQRAVVYLNGVRISSSNNYTQDGFLSRRLQYGDSYNKSVNSMYNMTVAAAYTVPADAAAAVNKWIAKDTLDSFWLRQSEGLIVPPNSNIRFEFTSDPNFWLKNYMIGSGNPIVEVGTTAPKMKTISMHPCFYVNPSEVKPNYRLRFISINSFMSQLAANETRQTIQYTISPTITKVCYTMLAANYQTKAISKRATAFTFDNSAAIQTLQFKHGNVVFPQTVYSFAYGLDQAYEDYVNHSQQIAKDSGKEIYDMYANACVAPNANNWGPIFVAPIVKDRTDPTNTIELNATFTGVAATTYTLLSSLEEQAIDISMDGMEIKTTPTI